MTDPHEPARRAMVKNQLERRGIRDLRVLEACRRVPRDRFVAESDVHRAYEDHPLAIGHGQTISQPYMVALMTQCLELTGSEKVLEIGTGSGYQTAILCELAKYVHSMERIEALSECAGVTLQYLGYSNFELRVADGTLGWPDEAPFDRIIVTAAAPDIPGALQDQLADGGILVIPVGPPGLQTLQVLHKRAGGATSENVCDCVFVKLIGQEGYDESS